MTAEAQHEPETTEAVKPALTAAARRDLLAELAAAIGETAIVEGDKLIVETGDPVALYIHVRPDGAFTLIKWMTASHPSGHPRWREAAGLILGEGESIFTSALGGGFLIEIERRAGTIAEAVSLVRERASNERIHTLAAEFPEAIGLLDAEPVPDYLLPDREIS